MRPLLLLALAGTLVASVAATPTPDAPCDTIPELSERACASAEAGGSLAAGLCDHTGAPADACGLPRGQAVDPALVAAYAESDLARLHAAQRALGDGVPLGHAQVLASHNSYNSSAYLPAVSNQDPNHWYSMADQLTMEMRAIELDVHTWYGVDADGRLPVLCHATGPHLGCSADRPLVDGLVELRAWLDANPGEVLLIDVENHLEGAAGHDEAAALVATHLGDLLYAPPADRPCAAMPLDVSFADIRAAGAQVLLVSSCGSGVAWGALVHHYGDWHQSRLAAFDPQTCGPSFDRATYDGSWTRHWEDTTWLTAMAGGVGPRLDAATTSGLMACGLSQPSFDRLHPQDERLTATLWSWAADERPWEAGPSDIAIIASDGRLRVATAAHAAGLPALCRTGSGPAAFTVAADGTCDGGVPATPRTAREMALALDVLRAADLADTGARTGHRPSA